MIAAKHLSRGLAAVSLAWALTAASGAVYAQSNVGDRLSRLEQQVQKLQGTPGAPGAALSPTDVEGRLLSLERSIEQLTGEVEEAKFRSERNAEQLRVLTEDINLRVATLEQSIGAAPGTAPVAALAPAPSPAAPAPRAASAQAQTSASQRFSLDAPASQPMNPGPRASAAPPATVAAAAPAAGADSAVDANGGFVVRTDANGKALAADPNAPAPVQNTAPPPPAPVPRAAPAAPSVTGNQLSSLPVTDVKIPGGPVKEQYDYAFDFLKRNDYARGEVALRQFLEKNPKDDLAGNAQYWLAQTFFARGNFQDAAREYMKGYQSYPKNAKAPDNLLQLGMSLEKLSQNDGACTALGLISKDYPKAPDQIKNATKTERTKLKCK